ncbi:MAG: proton-conducting transporter transmembrane domain-containing protein, partial [Chloroflexota bacterium]
DLASAQLISWWFALLPGDPVADLLLTLSGLLGLLLSIFSLRLRGGGHFFLMVAIFLGCEVFMTAADNVVIFMFAWLVAAFIAWAIGDLEAGEVESGQFSFPLRLSGLLGLLLLIFGLFALWRETGVIVISLMKPPAAGSGWINLVLLAAVILETLPLVGYTFRNSEPRLGWASSAFLVTGGAFMIGVYPYTRLLVGVYGSLEFGLWREAAIWVGLGGAIVCALAALGEQDSKRIVSYGAFGQLLLIFAGLALPNPRGLLGVFLVLAVYTFATAALYLSLGLVEAATGTRSLSQLGGVGATHPNLGLASLMGALALGGIPPLGAFLGQVLLFSSYENLTSPWPAILYGLALLLNALYLLRLFRAVFLGASLHEPLRVRTRVAGIGLAGVTATMLAFASLPFWAEGILTPIVGYLLR